MPAPAGKSHRSFWLAVKEFYWKAYEDNLTGLSSSTVKTMGLLMKKLPCQWECRRWCVLIKPHLVWLLLWNPNPVSGILFT